MKKEELLALELTEEQIEKIFVINGKDVEKAKGELATYQTQVETLKEQLTEANTQIDKFKDLDVEGIKKASDEYKAKFEETKLQSEQELAKLTFNHELENAIRDSKARNVTAVKALLDTETLRGSSNRNDDLAKALAEVKASNDYLFEGEATVQGTGGSLGAGNKGKVGITKESIMGIENSIERKQKIAENIELFN